MLYLISRGRCIKDFSMRKMVSQQCEGVRNGHIVNYILKGMLNLFFYFDFGSNKRVG